MLKYDLYIFDWDGTLMDAAQVKVNAVIYACHTLGLKVVSTELAQSILGKNFIQKMLSIVPELRNNSELLQKFIATYERNLNDYTLGNKLSAGVLKVLDQLTAMGKFIAIATGGSRAMLNASLVDIEHYFLISKTACECFSKPHPQMIEEILDFTGINKEQAVMIGDTQHDLQMAQNAGVDSILIGNTGFSGCNPCYVLKDVSELYKLLV